MQKDWFIINKQLWGLWKFRKLNLTKKWKVLIMFDDMVADMESNKKLSSIVFELFLR